MGVLGIQLIIMNRGPLHRVLVSVVTEALVESGGDADARGPNYTEGVAVTVVAEEGLVEAALRDVRLHIVIELIFLDFQPDIVDVE